MTPLLVAGIVLILASVLSLLFYRWGGIDTKKKLLSEKYFFGEKKYQEGYAQALLDIDLPKMTPEEADEIAIAAAMAAAPPPKKTRVVKKFSKGKK